MTFTTTTEQTIERNDVTLTGNIPPAGCDQHASYSRPVDVFAPFNYLTNMALVIEIEQAIAGNECVIALGIKRSIADQVPANRILKEVREMIQDNRVVMEDMLSVHLVKRISNGI